MSSKATKFELQLILAIMNTMNRHFKRNIKPSIPATKTKKGRTAYTEQCHQANKVRRPSVISTLAKTACTRITQLCKTCTQWINCNPNRTPDLSRQKMMNQSFFQSPTAHCLSPHQTKKLQNLKRRHTKRLSTKRSEVWHHH